MHIYLVYTVFRISSLFPVTRDPILLVTLFQVTMVIVQMVLIRVLILLLELLLLVYV